ncbi:CHAT domain-containing protein [Rufibacter sp. DG15C]|uniref:CHAT domain-containing protein n=1 Tax=Rufibacter sp. DG15C TaxID=1379909 RepID=UPI000A768694|nr:CHAT domain-containing tetratricopeptide repeat protein [Rufibacter sp. DG15C]
MILLPFTRKSITVRLFASLWLGLFSFLFHLNAQASAPISKEKIQHLLTSAEEDRLVQQFVLAYLKYNQALEYEKALDSLQWVTIQHGMAACLIRLNAPESAQSILDTTHPVIQRRFGQKSGQMVQWYDLMGELYYKRLVIDPALVYWKKANKLALELYGPTHINTARTYRQLGRFFIGEADVAVDYALKAVQILRRQPKYLQHKEAFLYYNVLGYAIHEEKYDLAGYTREGKHYPSNLHGALAYYDSALIANRNRRGDQTAATAMVYHNMGNSYNNLYGFRKDLAPALQKDADLYFASANRYYDKAIGIFEKTGVHPGSVTLTLTTKAILLQLKDDWETSLQLYSQGLQRLMPQANITNALQLPPVPVGVPQREYLLLLTGKIKSLLKIYEAKKEVAYLKAYHQHVVQYISFLEAAKREATSLAGNTGRIDYEGASEGYGWGINASYLLYQTTGQDRYMQQALDIANRFKGYSLLHNEVKHQATSDKKTTLQEIARQKLEERWKELEEKKALLALYPKLGKTVTFKNVPEDYQRTKTQIEVQAKNKVAVAHLPVQTVPTVQQLQKELAPDEALLELVHFDQGITPQRNKLFAFIITKEKVAFIKLNDMDTTLHARIPALHQALAQRQGEQYRESAYHVYQDLAKPLLRHIPPHTKKLIFLPDSEYWRIPFATLLTKPVRHLNFREYPFLLHQYHISYAHSSAYWYVLRKGSAGNRLNQEPKVLAMAPFGLPDKEQVTGALQLPFTASLLHHLNGTLPGTFLVNEKATEEYFKQNANRYSILHLATHAEANADEPGLSKFQLSKSGSEDGVLYLEELMELNLRPALAILSACETGIGVSTHRNRAELQSLSWSFKFIGAQSTVATLWKVDDRSTAALLKDFYKGILAGEDKSVALSMAKRNYLAQARTSEEAHPFYWAGLVLNGQDQAFETSVPFGKWLKLSLISYLVLLLAYGGRQVYLQRARR